MNTDDNNARPLCGYLELIIGAMFSGKTSRLVEIYKQYTDIMKDSVLVINYIGDNRYHENMLCTHDNVNIPCEYSKTLSIWLNSKRIAEVDVILVNEGQFFEDLYECVHIMVEKLHKKVYVCGLSGDYRRKKIGSILDLVPLCDKIIKLTSKCSLCHNMALFSYRKNDNADQYVIGGSDIYMPLCRCCYLSKNI